MVTTPVLFDTCILIDYLRGVPQARTECDRHADRAISIITWMEVFAGATASDEDDTGCSCVKLHHCSADG